MEIDEEFASREEWLRFHDAHPQLFEPAFHGGVVRRIRSDGIHFRFEDRQIQPDQIEIDEAANYRETFVHDGIISRHRAVLDVLTQSLAGPDPRLYCSEALSAFAGLLERRFPRFVGSEFVPGDDHRDTLAGVRHEDLLALSIPAASFDIAIANEVFEHVPDLDRAQAELARVLDRRGSSIATFPFEPRRDEDLVKARLVDGEIEHHSEPEWHANPIDERGSLVFQIPGWSILQRLRDAGFGSARFHYRISAHEGILANR